MTCAFAPAKTFLVAEEADAEAAELAEDTLEDASSDKLEALLLACDAADSALLDASSFFLLPSDKMLDALEPGLCVPRLSSTREESCDERLSAVPCVPATADEMLEATSVAVSERSELPTTASDATDAALEADLLAAVAALAAESC